MSIYTALWLQCDSCEAFAVVPGHEFMGMFSAKSQPEGWTTGKGYLWCKACSIAEANAKAAAESEWV